MGAFQGCSPWVLICRGSLVLGVLELGAHIVSLPLARMPQGGGWFATLGCMGGAPLKKPAESDLAGQPAGCFSGLAGCAEMADTGGSARGRK